MSFQMVVRTNAENNNNKKTKKKQLEIKIALADLVHLVRLKLQGPSVQISVDRIVELHQGGAPFGTVTLDGQPAQVARQEMGGFVADAPLFEVLLLMRKNK